MSRLDYSYDEEFPGQFDLWQANCHRSLRGRAGKKELRQLRDALLALPLQRLIHGELVNEVGEVCAIGAYAQHKGLDLYSFDSEDDEDQVGIKAGMPKLVAWKVVEMNDLECDRYTTPEERYRNVLRWVDDLLLSSSD